MRKRRGFTLIELLVVIAVIALLMAILMSALARAKKQARTVACRALLQQWGPIWFMYCNDNNGFFSNGNISGVDWRRGEWVIVLRPMYETKSEILRCPMAVKRLPSNIKLDGRSLVPLLQNPNSDWRDPYVFVHQGRWARGMAAQSKYKNCALRNSRFRLVNNEELYDIKSDPGETTTLGTLDTGKSA